MALRFKDPESISVNDPRYKKHYDQGQIMAYYPERDAYVGQTLAPVEVRAKDERVRSGIKNQQTRFLSSALDYFSQPQKQAVGAITGKDQYPSEAWGFRTPEKRSRVSWRTPTSRLDHQAETEARVPHATTSASNMMMDVVGDPINLLPGIGVWSMARSQGPRTATKGLFKKLPPPDAVDLNIDEVLKQVNARHFDPRIDRIARQEVEKQLSPENFARAAKWDSKYGTNLSQSLSELKTTVESRIGYPFHIRVLPDDLPGIAGQSRIKNPFKRVAFDPSTPKSDLLSNIEPLNFDDFETILSRNYTNWDDKELLNVLQHELRHNLEHNMVQMPEAAKKRFSNIVRKNVDIDPDEVVNNALKNNPNIKLDEIENIRKEAEGISWSNNYHTEPVEVSPYAVSEFRQNMLDKGFIKKIDERITPQKIENFLSENKDFRRFHDFLDPNKRKEHADLMNEYLLQIGGGLGATGAATSQRQKLRFKDQ